MRLLLHLSLAASALAVWPVPAQYTAGSGTLWIDQNVKIVVNGVPTAGSGTTANGNANQTPAGSQIVQAAIQRTQKTLFEQGFVPWKFYPRNSDFEPATTNKAFINTLTLTLTGADPANILRPQLGEVDESYSLTLTAEGAAEISAKTSIGLSRGLTTFTQLFYAHTEGGAYTRLAPVSIQDGPKFAHRGINMDTSRNFFSVDDIKRMIDAAAFVKMNRLHLHITDAQSWPLEIPALPELAAKGRYRNGYTYSPEQIRDIQYTGALQGVQVIIEIDMPGHTSSIAYAYPELIAAFNIQPNWGTYAASPPSGTLKLNSPAVYDFLKKLFDDLLPRLSPYSAYYHFGGDEVKAAAYLFDDTVKSNETSVLTPLLQKFLDTVHGHIRAAGLIPIVWEEMLLQWNLTLGPDVLVQAWQSEAAAAQTVARGFKTLVGNADAWYLDCGYGQWVNFIPGPSSRANFPYNDYCAPMHNWRAVYAVDPLHGIPAANHALVVGGEVHMWAEQTDPASIDAKVWPRAAAAAEILWSGARDAAGQNRSQIEAAPRLSELRERLVARGVAASTIQMPYCTQEKEQCTLS